mgnify:CR=1 FL=1
MNNKNLMFLVIILLVTVDLIVFYLAIDKITHFKNAKDTLKILISIIGLFTTFGGAYLGAKISGNNAIKLEDKKRMLEYEKESYTLRGEISKFIRKNNENLANDVTLYTIYLAMKNSNINTAELIISEDDLKIYLKHFNEKGKGYINQLENYFLDNRIFSLRKRYKNYFNNLRKYELVINSLYNLSVRREHLLKENEKKENNENLALIDDYAEINIDTEKNIKEFSELSLLLLKNNEDNFWY